MKSANSVSPKVRRYFSIAEDLMKTPRTMRDIFEVSTAAFGKRLYSDSARLSGRRESITYRRYHHLALQYASRLSGLTQDIPAGAIVGLKLKNSPEWGLFFWALLSNGFIPFLLDARALPEVTAHFLEQAGAQAVIADDYFDYPVRRVTSDALTHAAKIQTFVPRWENRVIFASSGTTGEAKLMVFDGENLCHQVNAAVDMPQTTKDIMYPFSMGPLKILAFIPFHHIFGFVAVFLWYTFFGKTLVFAPDFNPTTLLETCRKEKVTHVYAVPLFWDALTQNLYRKAALMGPEREALLATMIAYHTGQISRQEAGLAGSGIALRRLQKNLLGKHVRYCISGGGGLMQKTVETINGIGYPLYNGYGMTEIGVTSVELSPRVADRLLSSIGTPLHGIAYKIVPQEAEHPDIGELYIASKITHRQEIKNKRFVDTVLVDGWFPSGDIAQVDKKGRYWIKGRLKDVIINANGENIYPDDLENAFRNLPGVKTAAVLGFRAGESLKEQIVLVVETAPAAEMSAATPLKEALKEANAALPQAKQAETIYFIDRPLPLTSSMKVQKHVLRAWLTEHPEYFTLIGAAKTNHFEGYPSDLITSLLNKVRGLFAQVLVLPESAISDSGHFVNDLGGDSLSYTELVSDIDEQFGLTIPEESFGRLVSVNDFVEEIAKNQLKKAA